MADTDFRPFQTMLDHDAALRKLQEATAGADDGELFLERRRAEALVFDDGRVKTASYDATEGFGLRAVRGEVSGYRGPHSSGHAYFALKDERARIEATGTASLSLHAACGFELVGIERQVGRKFNRWLDVAVMQRLL